MDILRHQGTRHKPSPTLAGQLLTASPTSSKGKDETKEKEDEHGRAFITDRI
jgi:hypothetical protein